MEARSKNVSKRGLIIGIAVLAIVAVVVFTFFWPPEGSDGMQGTIGAAKKYRAEQITDKDVNLEGVQADASATAAVDDATVQGLHRTAEELEMTASRFDAKSPFGKQAAATFQRTAQAMKTLEAYAVANKPMVEKSVASDLAQRAGELSAAARDYLDKNQGLDKQAADNLSAAAQFVIGQAAAIEKTAALLDQKAGYERAADVNDLLDAAASLKKTASDLGAKGAVGKSAANDLSKAADAVYGSAIALEKQASSYDRSGVEKLERDARDLSAAASLNMTGALDASAVSSLAKNAITLQKNAAYFGKNFGLEANASLDRNAGFEKSTGLEKNANLGKETALDRNASVGNKAASGQ